MNDLHPIYKIKKLRVILIIILKVKVLILVKKKLEVGI